MDLALSVHARLATVLALYYAAVGLWGLALGVRNSGPTSGFRGAIAIAVIAAVAQGLAGILTFAFVRPPNESLHVLYGVALALAMPLASTLVRDRTPRGQSVALGLASLFAAGLAIRGITTS
jgi:MFS family permease